MLPACRLIFGCTTSNVAETCSNGHNKGRDLVRTKVVIDYKIIEQVNLFNCIGNMISYEGELDIDNKLNNILKITGIFK
jgi:hypothetical protein